MNILILNNLPIETGVGRYTYNLYNSLKDENIKIINFANYHDYKNRTFIGDIIRPKYKNSILNILFGKINNRRILKIIYNYNGIVHYAAHTIPVYKSKATKIGTVHDFFPIEIKSEDNFAYRLYMQKNLKHILNLDNIIITTNIYKTKLIEEYKYNGKVFVVPYAVSDNFIQIKDKKVLRKELNLPIDKILILSVSNNVPHKNLKILPSVMKLLGDKFSLVRIGDKIGESITFSYADNILINKIYNACDVLVFPSLEEGFGFPMIEAFATGLPVVASNIPVFHEIGGDAPIYVNNKNPESIANGIINAIKNKEEMSKNSLGRSKLYTIDNLGKKMINVYKSII